MKKKINWKVLSFNYVDENNEFPFVYQKMQELIGHHHEIYERLGFKICNHQDKGYSIGTEFSLQREYAIPECIGVMCKVDFFVMDFITRNCNHGLNNKTNPYICISAHAQSAKTHALSHLEMEYTQTVVNRRHPRKTIFNTELSYLVAHQMISENLYEIYLKEGVSDKRLEFEINTCLDIVDIKMKNVFGFERTA